MLALLWQRAWRLGRIRALLSMHGLLLLWWYHAVPTELHRLNADDWRGQAWLQSVSLILWLEAIAGSSPRSAATRGAGAALAPLQDGRSLWCALEVLSRQTVLLLLAGGLSLVFGHFAHKAFHVELQLLLAWLAQVFVWTALALGMADLPWTPRLRGLASLILGLALFLFFSPYDGGGQFFWWGTALLLLALCLAAPRNRAARGLAPC